MYFLLCEAKEKQLGALLLTTQKKICVALLLGTISSFFSHSSSMKGIYSRFRNFAEKQLGFCCKIFWNVKLWFFVLADHALQELLLWMLLRQVKTKIHLVPLAEMKLLWHLLANMLTCERSSSIMLTKTKWHGKMRLKYHGYGFIQGAFHKAAWKRDSAFRACIAYVHTSDLKFQIWKCFWVWEHIQAIPINKRSVR